MEAKHTPGPWEWSRYGNNDGDYQYLRQKEEQHHPSVLSPEEGQIYDEYDSDPPHIDIKDADANLIVAAPDLLEALQNTMALVDLKYGNTDHTAGPVMDLAHAAVAKARGQ